ncbi:MAG: hypothetical protein V3U65_10895 [Granulosicoccaceae bacterium]
MKSLLKLLQPATQSIFLSIIFFSASYALDEPSETDCQCRAPTGDMKNLGTVECVNVTGRQYLVRCEMSTNTPYWNKLDGVEGCPIT